jgi:amino acid synthesis protein
MELARMNVMNPRAAARTTAFENELVQVRKFVVTAEEILHEGGPKPARTRTRAAVAAVLRNPYAGKYVAEIMPMMEALKPLGLEMSRRLIDALGGDPKAIEAYGKGAIVGEAGELEHGALWHVPGGYAMRELLGGAKAIVPSSKKVGPPGARLDVPVTHIDASYVRSHFDAIEVGVPGAPAADEIVYVLAMTDGPRVHDRAGGLKVSEIKGEDGLR